MKQICQKYLIRIFSTLLVLITTATVVLSLSMCQYKDPLKQNEEEEQPLGDYDYSKRAFFTGTPDSSHIYKGDAYFIDTWCRLKRVSLSELSCDMRTSKSKQLPKTYAICTDNTHDHEGGGATIECPDSMVDVGATFLIDAYESNGDFPIIYYCRRANVDILDEDNWDNGTYDTIVRYDTGKMETSIVAATKNSTIQTMAYDQLVFFVTVNSKKVYEINVVSKKGGDVTTVTAGNGELTLLGAYDDRIIFRDADGAIYQAGFDLQNIQQIFKVSVVNGLLDCNKWTFVHGKYLYYSDNYGAIPYPISDDGTQVLNLIMHSVRRVSLDDPQGESELVAENVLDQYMFGVSNNVFYYSPCLALEKQEGYYYKFSGGLLKGVNLETLEAVEMQEDVGLDFGSAAAYASGNAIVSVVFPVREGYNNTYYDGEYYFLYDIKTGALYPLYMTA